ncbi:hypothetical protein PIROE2DRAFT_1132 [Piromyces sp. E2]|nr:hypothetical protein PIROE2DRAFT_1132 [Piromyces sp. E2]|eukprot:OUM70608.1 hypothetical protein PIROE2DRAFT_1132 [Piromyces sp. E2]
MKSYYEFGIFLNRNLNSQKNLGSFKYFLTKRKDHWKHYNINSKNYAFQC